MFHFSVLFFWINRKKSKDLLWVSFSLKQTLSQSQNVRSMWNASKYNQIRLVFEVKTHQDISHFLPTIFNFHSLFTFLRSQSILTSSKKYALTLTWNNFSLRVCYEKSVSSNDRTIAEMQISPNAIGLFELVDFSDWGKLLVSNKSIRLILM